MEAKRFLTDRWYAAALSREIGQRPLGRQLLNRSLVFFRDTSGKVCALNRYCPHRNADLAQGRVVDGVLQCAFHGWCFSGNGQCVQIPSLGSNGVIPDAAHPPSYPTYENAGVVYVWPRTTAPTRPAPQYEFLTGYKRYAGSYLQEGTYQDTVSVTMDASHLAFLHKRSVGWAMQPEQPRINIELADSELGVSGQLDLTSADELAAMPSFSPWRWLRPDRTLECLRVNWDFTCVSVHARYRNGKQNTAFALITPASGSHTWFFPGIAASTKPNILSRLILEIVGRRVLAEDRHILRHIQPGNERLSPRVNVSSDALGVAFERVYHAALDENEVHIERFRS